jgi:hypothetical protein
VSASQLLAVWERCAARTPAERALELLALSDCDAPGSLTAGERDGLLLDLRERLFGSELAGAARCEACGEEVEFSLRTDDVRVSGSEPLAPLARVPTAADLALISREPDAASARRRLVELCLPEGGDVAELAEALAAADPQADVELSLSCPECGHEWSAVLDPGWFVWSELDAWARRTLRAVHALAAAYGWSEAEILALGPRRHVYLELVGA